MPVAILLPTLNEAEGIGKVIDRLRAVQQKGWQIFVVDSGSSDRTVEIARAKGVEVIEVPVLGKGIAVKAAFRQIEADQLVMIDSDMSYMPEEVPLILEKLNECDVAVGSRFRGSIEQGSMGPVNRVGNHLLSMLASALYLRSASDVCSGMWGFRKSAYKAMEIDAPHFELEVNFFVQCAKKKLRLCEVPINYKRREGRTKLSAMHGISIGLYLLTRRFM